MLKDFINVSCVLGHMIHVMQLVSVHSNEILKKTVQNCTELTFVQNLKSIQT